MADSAHDERLKHSGNDPNAWCELAISELNSGRLDEADRAFRLAIQLNAQLATAWDGLGIVHRLQGRMQEAEQCARQAIGLEPHGPAAWLNLGIALYGQLRWAEAVMAFRQSLNLDPNDAATWANLGAAELVQSRLAEAQRAYEQSLALAPGNMMALTNCSLIAARRGQIQQAQELLKDISLAASPSADSCISLGNVYNEIGDAVQAEAAYRRALELSPQNPQALQNLALVLESQMRLADAEAVIRQILATSPDSSDAWSLLAGIHFKQGHHAQAIEASQRSLQIANQPVLHSRVLQFLQYADTIALEPLQQSHREWNQVHAQPLRPANPPSVKPLASGHKLRLGFVSADFGTHPIAFLTPAALEHLDKARCSIICYSDRTTEDRYTRRFRAASDLWRSIPGWTDDEVARQVRDDQIDVLIDLAGHHGKRLLVFARKPAPLQLTWAGYVGTTGLVAMDGLIADRFHVLPAEEPFYCERILRMPHGYICYSPPDDAPSVAPLPAQSSGRFTFGSFNNFAKCGSIILDVWAEILRREPGAQLLLKSPGLQLAQNQALFIDRFARRGIGAERILFEGSSSPAEHLAAYGRVDLALDTLPYSGGVTTCDALWMGVPVVTCPGPTFAGRHSTSHLSNAGFSNFVAADLNGYLDLARYYVHHQAELAAIRAPMRETMRASPLCDAARFASDFLALLTQAWQSRAASSVVGYASP